MFTDVNILLAALAVLTTASGYYVSTGLHSFWPAAWVAPVPILLYATSPDARSRRRAGVAAAAAFFLGSMNLFGYLASVMPAALVAVLLLVPSLVFALAVLAARSAVQRLPAWAAAFAFPLVWTTYEYLVSLASPHGTALSLAYSQTDFLPVLQVVSITGIWGLTFLVAWVPAALAIAWRRRAVGAAIPAFAALLAVCGWGGLRLAEHDSRDTLRVGLAATDVGMAAAFDTEDGALASETAGAYAARAARLASQGAELVILPEKFVGITPATAANVTRAFDLASREGKATIVAGFNQVGTEPKHNIAMIFRPTGPALVKYEKHHLLPGPESGYAVGYVPLFYSQGRTRVGVAICKDMDFPPWLRLYGMSGVRLMAVPAWDFVRDARMHSRMAVVRAVENGFTLARVAQEGFLTFADDRGRILAEQSSWSAPEVLMVRDVPLGQGGTFYSRNGDWFGWLVVTVLAWALFLIPGRPDRGSVR